MIKEKYDQLEEELIEKRLRTKTDMADFMEENVLIKWTALRNHRLRTEARLKHSHQVCYASVMTPLAVMTALFPLL